MNTPQRPRRSTSVPPFRTNETVHPRRVSQSHSAADARTSPPQPSRARTADELASQREMFGFDDIPIDVDDVPMSQIVRAWLRRGIRHSELEKHSSRFKSVLTRKKISGIKNDIKWAMAADLDEEELRPAPSPEPRRPLREKSAPTHTATPAPVPTTKSVDININFGELPKLPNVSPKALARRLKLSKKTLIVVSAVVVVGVGGVAVWQMLAPNHYRLPIVGKQATPRDEANLPKETPSYTTLTPNGTPAKNWTRISPESSAPAYSFADTLENTRIIVTQQQLPRGVKTGDDTELARIAASFSATDKSTNSDIVFYRGSASGSTQHVITAKDGLLILIRSEQPLDEDVWATYLDNLK